MKIQKTMFAMLATIALAACNNNNEVLDSYNDDTESTLDVTIQLPETKSQLTRGAIIGNDDVTLPPEVVVSRVILHVRDERGFTVMSKTVTGNDINIDEDNKVKVEARSTKIKSTSKVITIINYKYAGLSSLSIADLQPTNSPDNSGVEKAIYVSTMEPIIPVDNKENYYTASLIATSIVARTEVLGKSKFNPKTVYSMDLAFVSPVNYHLIYDLNGGEQISKSKDPKNILGLGAVKMDVNGTLLDKNGTAFDLNTLAAVNEGLIGDKANGAVVNHLFAGDPTKMHIGFLIKTFDLIVNNEGTYLATITDTHSYVYKGKDDKLYAFTENGKTKAVTIDANGKAVVSGPELDMTKEDMKIDTRLRFYTLANFGRSGNTGVYESGINYIINLEKLKWSSVDGYDPGPNPGREDPDDNDTVSTVDVEIEIAPWENHTPEVIPPADYN